MDLIYKQPPGVILYIALIYRETFPLRFGGNIEDVAKVEKLLEDREKMTEEFFKEEEEEKQDEGEEENLTENKNDVLTEIGTDETKIIETEDKETGNEDSEKVEEAAKDTNAELMEQDIPGNNFFIVHSNLLYKIVRICC